MVKIDLITGFLGAGKTTFIKKYAAYLLEQGMNIGILENDFGAVNVDMLLLQDLMGEKCELEMVSGGCDADCHKRRFRTKLIAMGMCGYDRVIVEPSGIYDVDEFFDALREEPLDQWYEIGNVIALVDAKQERLSGEAQYLLASEAANAGRIILSHASEVSKEQTEKTVRYINDALGQIKCPRRVDNAVIKKSTSELTDEDLAELLHCGYQMERYEKADFRDKNGFESVYFMNVKMTKEELEKAVMQAMQDGACGGVFRVKGFVKDAGGNWFQLNATRNGVTTEPVAAGQEVVIVIGNGLNETKLGTYIRI